MRNCSGRAAMLAALFVHLLFFSSWSYAQEAVTCPPAPNLVKATLSAMVTFDSSTNLYRYEYTVASDFTSQQEISDFAIDFGSSISGVENPQGWTDASFDGRNTIHWKAAAAAPVSPDQPDVGQVPPSPFQIKPGDFLSGFSFTSPNPPGPVHFHLLGYTDLPGADTEAGAEILTDACPQIAGGFFELAVTGTTQGPVLFIPVEIAIKPASAPNSINPHDRGVISVAILSTDAFDATTVDPRSVKFGPAGAPAQNAVGRIEDINNDGIPDLVLQFPTQATGIACGETSAKLTGKTLQGTSIQGTGSIVTIDCKKDRGAAAAERGANQEKQRIERSEVIQWGEVLAAKLAGGENQTRPGSGTAQRAYKVEIGNSGPISSSESCSQ